MTTLFETPAAPTAGAPAMIPTKSYERPCDQCGKTFRVRPSAVRKAVAKGNKPPRFCSSKCQHESYRGAGNPKWRGGRIVQTSGYVYAYAPNHPHATQDGYVMEHRLVVERTLGRFLRPEEVVHHRNHDPGDNRLENLELMPSQTAHRERHGYFEDHSCAACGAPVRRSAAHRRRWTRAFCSRRCAALTASQAAAQKARTQ